MNNTISTKQTPQASFDELLDRMKKTAAKLRELSQRPEPIEEFIRSQGFDPDQYMLVLPESMRKAAGPLPSPHLMFSSWIPDGKYFFVPRLKPLEWDSLMFSVPTRWDRR